MSKYWDWLCNAKTTNQKLKWCHRTDSYTLREILKQGAVKPMPCDVFAKNLSYFFYGRPAYRNNETRQLRLLAYAPAIIIFKHEIENFGEKIYPFDTGAYNDRYKTWAHTNMPIDAFEMPCNENAHKKHIFEFFGNEENYINMLSKYPSRTYGGEFEVEMLAEMINDKSSEYADDRRLAIELQVSRDIEVNSINVDSIVIPDSMEGATWLNDWAKQNKSIKIILYPYKPLFNAGHYQSQFEQICTKHVFLENEKSNAF